MLCDVEKNGQQSPQMANRLFGRVRPAGSMANVQDFDCIAFNPVEDLVGIAADEQDPNAVDIRWMSDRRRIRQKVDRLVQALDYSSCPLFRPLFEIVKDRFALGECPPGVADIHKPRLLSAVATNSSETMSPRSASPIAKARACRSASVTR